MSEINKVVLAYSGGLDTSVILKWLQDVYHCEVVTFTADLGQGEEVEPARTKALSLGIKEIYIDDLREEFARDFVFPMFRANTVYEGEYLLGTSIARPLIAKRLIEIANETGANAIAHGATGKGQAQGACQPLMADQRLLAHLLGQQRQTLACRAGLLEVVVGGTKSLVARPELLRQQGRGSGLFGRAGWPQRIKVTPKGGANKAHGLATPVLTGGDFALQPDNAQTFASSAQADVRGIEVQRIVFMVAGDKQHRRWPAVQRREARETKIIV